MSFEELGDGMCASRDSGWSSALAPAFSLVCALLSSSCGLLAGVHEVVLEEERISWGARFGDKEQQVGAGVAVDAANNVILTGWFQGTVDFGGGPLTSAGDRDIFVAKLDDAGGHSWSKSFGDASEQTSYGVAVDGEGNVFVAGAFRGTVDFGGGPLSAGASSHVFVAKFDPTGKLVFSKDFGQKDGSAPAVAHGLATDGSGNVLVTGAAAGLINFGGGDLPVIGPGDDAFVVKLDPMGNHLWSKRFGDSVGWGIAVDGAGDAIVTGQFGTTDFGGEVLASGDDAGVFLVKLDGDGNHVWSEGFGGAGIQVGSSVAVDGVGNIAVTGYFEGDVDFGGQALASAGGEDIFVAKLDASGGHLWSKGFGDGADKQRGRSVAMDGKGNVLLTGSLFGSADFGGGALTSAGQDDLFVAKLDETGDFAWNELSGEQNSQSGAGIAADRTDQVLVVGHVEGRADFGSVELQSAGSYDVLVVSLEP